MAHNLDMTGNRANMAFIGLRTDIWHRLGQQMESGMSIDQWATAAGLAWQAVKVPAIAALEGAQFDHIPATSRFAPVENTAFVVRDDTGAVLGRQVVSDVYQPVQPRDVLDWFDRYIAVDDRFQLDVAGSLRGGSIIWATAVFRDKLDVAGDAHLARVLMTTTFDGSGSTINKATMTRVVCNNTLTVALMDPKAEVRTRHNTTFNPARVGAELAQLAQGFARYKALGDAMAQDEMAGEDVSRLFKHVLDIPFETPKEQISTRKLNQFQGLKNAYATTVAEGAPAKSAWAALNAITRYVDHDRATRGDNQDESRFESAQFGSGAGMKAKAMEILLPRIKDKVPVAA